MGNRVDLRRALPLGNIAKMRRYALESVWRTEFGSSVDFFLDEGGGKCAIASGIVGTADIGSDMILLSGVVTQPREE